MGGRMVKANSPLQEEKQPRAFVNMGREEHNRVSPVKKGSGGARGKNGRGAAGVKARWQGAAGSSKPRCQGMVRKPHRRGASQGSWNRTRSRRTAKVWGWLPADHREKGAARADLGPRVISGVGQAVLCNRQGREWGIHATDSDK